MKKLEQTASGSWALEWENPAYPVPTEPPKRVENVGEVQNLADVQPYQTPQIIYVPQQMQTPQDKGVLMTERTQEIASKIVGATLIMALLGGLFLVATWVLSVLAEGLGSLASIAKSLFEVALYGLGIIAAYFVLRYSFESRGSSKPPRPYDQPTTSGTGQQNITININGGGNQQINRY